MPASPDLRLVPLRDSLVGRVLRGSGNTAYYLRECIGEGGQGWVFRANWDDPSGHVVIVKVLRPDVVATEALRRFQREAEVLRMLSTQGRPNPYIVRFYDHAIAQVPSPRGPEPLTLPFTVLEFVDGTTLEKEIVKQRATGRGFPAERVRRLLRQICQALDVVHKQKVVHRDLKPSNILLANEAGTEVAKVTDFGLVKLVDVNLQKTSALAGASLGYAPPEQYEQGNQRVSPRTDVFSLAAVVFEMLSTKPAFPFIDGENPLLIVTRILNGPRPSLMKARASLAPELEASATLIEALDRELARALAADPAARHESSSELWSALEPSLRAAAEEHKSPPRSQVSPYEATARAGEAPSSGGGSGVRVRSDDQQPFVATPSAPRLEASKPDAPRPERVAEAQAANPAAWTWSMLTPAIATKSIRAVVFTATADAAIALTASGLVRWERGTWVPVTLPSHVPRSGLRGLRWMRDGSVLLFGEGGFVARHVLGGATTLWRVPDPEITFLGALVEESGVTTLVGERPYRGGAARSFPGNTAGVVAQFSGDRVTVVGDAMGCARLHGVARMTDGQLVACGDWGAVVRVELGVVEFVASICAGHLLAIAPLPDGGAVTVGVGGHALSLDPQLHAQLEAVQTTRDLLCLTSTDDGQAWAGSAQARLVRRSSLGAASSWVRISGDIGVASSMVAIAAGPRTVRAIGDDGTVIEGRLA
ncbi:MAG: serine/threonine protein kinase [Labilithrix sp.]|nr:serine/threonine protein kinase [Labilithrix sp.]